MPFLVRFSVALPVAHILAPIQCRLLYYDVAQSRVLNNNGVSRRVEFQETIRKINPILGKDQRSPCGILRCVLPVAGINTLTSGTSEWSNIARVISPHLRLRLSGSFRATFGARWDVSESHKMATGAYSTWRTGVPCLEFPYSVSDVRPVRHNTIIPVVCSCVYPQSRLQVF